MADSALKRSIWRVSVIVLALSLPRENVAARVPVTVFFSDFESLTAEWQAGDTNTANGEDYWGLVEAQPMSGEKSAWCARYGEQGGVPNVQFGNYDLNMDAYLDTPPFSLFGYTQAWISVYAKFKIEGTGGCDYDYFQLMIVKENPPHDPLWSSGRYCGNNWGGWEHISLEITGYPLTYDGSCRARLFFHSDELNKLEGIYADDLSITAIGSSATPTPTPTATPSPALSPTATSTATPTHSPSPANTPPPTETGNPTRTPTPSPTPPPQTSATPTLTATPSATNSPTATSSATPAPSLSPTLPATDTPLPSVTPAETPAPPLTLALLLNQALYAPGDEFLFQAAVIKRVLESVAADQYIVLDVWGEYFFWPSWLQSVDFAPRTFIAPYDVEELLRFVWPDGAGDALGIMLWGALTRPDSIDLLSLDTAVFSFTGSSDPTPAPTETPDPTAAPSPTPTPTVGISPTPLPPRHVTLPGNVAWLDSGLDVREGEPLTVLGFGQICFHIGDCPGTTVGPCGYRDICYDPECQEQPYDPGFHHGGIIARIGDNPPFLICDEYSQSAPASGSLFLGINDGNVTDNGMEFQVYIVSEQ